MNISRSAQFNMSKYNRRSFLHRLSLKTTMYKGKPESYEFVQRENVVLDDYGVSFVINSGI